MTTAIDRFFQESEELEEDEEEKKKLVELARQKMMGWLTAKGLSDVEAQIASLRIIGKPTLRQIAGLVKVSKSKVDRILKAPHVRDAITEAKSAKRDKGLREQIKEDLAKIPLGRGKTLKEIKEWALRELSPASEEFEDTRLREWVTGGKRRSAWLRTREMAIVRKLDYSHIPPEPKDLPEVLHKFPALLLRNEGRPILEWFVDILEAAHFGACGHRRVAPFGATKREQIRKWGYDALRALFKPAGGCPYMFLDIAYGWVVHAYGHRILDLQQEWKKSLGLPLSGRLDRFRKSFPDDVEGLTDKKLRAMLSEDVVRAASRLAEMHTGISAELLEKGYLKRFRGFDPFAPPVPPRAKTPPG